MNKRPVTNNRDKKIRRERDPIPWRYCILTLICGLFLVAGFFWAANRHFSVMEFGIKNAKLRREKESLEAEQRRLYLMREIALSPAEIKKAAKKIGLQDLTPESIEVMPPAKLTETESKETENKETGNKEVGAPPVSDAPALPNPESREKAEAVSKSEIKTAIAAKEIKQEAKKEIKIGTEKSGKAADKEIKPVKTEAVKKNEKTEKKFGKNGDSAKSGEVRAGVAKN